MRLKICPACGEKNVPSSVECSSCGYDLMGVPAVDPEEQEKQEKRMEEKTQTAPEQDTGTAAAASESSTLVRICPECGTVNPPQARKCQQCHEDISDILPSPQEKTMERHYSLEQIGTQYIYPIPCGTIIIGREHEMREALANKPYVSRIHAKLTTAEGKLYIENLSSTNYTYVNNERIPEGRIELHPGDEIGLGGISVNGSRQEQAAYFIVGIMP